jgi:D-alanine-D-alanine ligase-like ATP-grasp enzyme
MPPAGVFRLSYGGRSIRCRESLSELTSAVALSICDDKAMTRRIVQAAGVKVPDEIEASDRDAVCNMLARHGSLVVKPARGEQGRGVAVDLDTIESVEQAIGLARQVSAEVLVESFHAGQDLRLIVIGFKLIAAAVRRPAEVVGNGRATVRQLIERQSRRRAAATGGESRIPLDLETERCVAKAGFAMDDCRTQAPASRSASRQPPHRRHHPRCHRPAHPALAEAADRGGPRDRHPGGRRRLIVADPTEPGLCFHRGE